MTNSDPPKLSLNVNENIDTSQQKSLEISKSDVIFNKEYHLPYTAAVFTGLGAAYNLFFGSRRESIVIPFSAKKISFLFLLPITVSFVYAGNELRKGHNYDGHLIAARSSLILGIGLVFRILGPKTHHPVAGAAFLSMFSAWYHYKKARENKPALVVEYDS